jgi:hypothetical protein
MAFEEDEVHWRKKHGEELRQLKGHEHDPDPDWSLAEFSRHKEGLAREFWDWLYDRGGAEDADGVRHMLDFWIEAKWTAPLTLAAKGLLTFAVMERMKKHVEEPTLPVVPPKLDGEDAADYVERIAEGTEVVPDEPPEPETMPPVPIPPDEPPSEPYRDDEQVKCADCETLIPSDWVVCPPCAAKGAETLAARDEEEFDWFTGTTEGL